MVNELYSKWRKLWRFSPWQWLKWGIIQAKIFLELPARLDSPDRHMLEQQILPFYAAQTEIEHVLFVGCDWYSKHYSMLFTRQQSFVTMDADPRQRRYGARQHLIAPMESLSRHIAPQQLDLIVCNGVFGYGLDEPKQVELAMNSAFLCLRYGGVLLFGWNNIPAHAPFDPVALIEAAGFERTLLSPLNSWRTTLDMPTRHTFEAYRRPYPDPRA